MTDLFGGQGELFADHPAPAPVSAPAVAATQGSGLWVHRAERADTLVAELGELLAGPRQDPFQMDVVSVPTKGVERWITQRLSHRLGVSAAIDFPSPAQLVSTCLEAVGPAADDDPWMASRLVHPVLATLDEVVEHPDLALVRGYLRSRAAQGQGRRWAAARLVADLFTDYGAQRPDLLRGWARGMTVAHLPPVPADLEWQEQVFAHLRNRVDVPFPAARTPPACHLLRQDPSSVGLPDQVHLFGPTRLTRDQVDILLALAAHRAVHLWLVHPSPALWERVRSTEVAAHTPRIQDPTATVADHPLLESWGRDCREMQVLLQTQAAAAGVAPIDIHHAGAAPASDSRLRRLQTSLINDDPAAARTPVADPSVQVHACHGPARQVEVLREVLLGLLADDSSLMPRDIVVMCPDVESYAPLLAAAFGLSDTLAHLDSAGWDVGEDVALHPGQQLRIRIADRSLHQANPVLAMVVALLDLATRRLTISEVLDFASQPVVRQRFRFSQEDLERVREWADVSGVRWGLNADHRGMFGVGGIQHNTWAAGLDRLLVGTAMGESSGYLGTALPLAEVDSTQIDLVGRWAEFIDRLGTFLEATTAVRPVLGWVDLLQGAVLNLTHVSDTDAWMAAHAEHALNSIAADASGPSTGAAVDVSAADVRQLVADRFGGRPTRAGFRTGDITACALAPMRSVPHRVVCLLGMDDATFPRRSAHDGENILLREPLIGERDRASEDRQLLLDAVMAATDNLVILYSGADEVTGRIRPPAVPVAELLDVLADPSPVLRHPLQPFDDRNFDPSSPFSFDPLALEAARARRAPATGAGDTLDTATVPALQDHAEVVDLEDLIRFFESPPKGYLQGRLGLRVRDEDELSSEQVPLDARGLVEWGIGDRMLTGLLAGRSVEAVAAYERRRGSLPPGELGTEVLERVSRRVSRLKSSVADLLDLPARTGTVRLELPVRAQEVPMVVQGVASGLRGNRVLAVTPSRLGAKHRLRAWITLLAVAAEGEPDDWQAVTLGRAEGGDSLRLSLLTAPDPDDARARLAELVRLRRLGLDAALPLPLKTAGRYAESRMSGMEADRALEEARGQWVDNRFPGEQSSAGFLRIWGRLSLQQLRGIDVDLSTLLSPQVGRDEAGTFGRLAVHVWHPLLQAEELRAG